MTAVAHGLYGLDIVQITYALPACRGQLTRQIQERLDALRKLARKFGFVPKIIPQPNYLTRQMLRLLRLVQRPEYCLYTINSCSMELSHRGHSFPFLSANIT